MKNSKLKSILQFIVLCAGGNAIFYVIFMRSSFYEAFLEAFTMTNEQFGVLFSCYAWVAVATYFLGGIVADKVSTKVLMVISFAGTGLLNIWFGTFPKYETALLIYALMGVTTTLTFWAALLKATRQFGQSVGSESKAFGGLEAGKAIFEVIFGTLAVFLFTKFAVMSAGLRFVIFMYGGILILLAIISLFVFDNGTGDEAVISEESPFKLLLQCLKNVDIWICALMGAGAYAIGSTLGSYCGDIVGSNYGATVAVMGYVGVMTAYFKPFGGLGAGWFGDKFGPSAVLLILSIVLTGFAVVFAFLPTGPEYIWLFLVLFAVEIVCTGAFRSQKYATIKEARVPMSLSVTAFGFMATIIYASDAFLPPVIGRFLDTYDSVTAYRYTMLILAGFGLLSVVLCLIFRYRNKNNIKEILVEEKEAKSLRKEAKQKSARA